MGDSTRFRGLRFETIRSFLRCLMFVVVILAIVNNGNILKDGTDERKYLQMKYHKLRFLFNKYIYLNDY